MSLELHVFLPTGEWPSVRRWQAAVSSLSLPVELDPTLDLSTASGFVACRVSSVDSGFEIWSDSITSIIAAYPGIVIGDSRRVVTFRWGGDLKECACALAAAAGLVVLAGALVYYPDDDLWYDIEGLKADFADALRG